MQLCSPYLLNGVQGELVSLLELGEVGRAEPLLQERHDRLWRGKEEGNIIEEEEKGEREYLEILRGRRGNGNVVHLLNDRRRHERISSIGH